MRKRIICFIMSIVLAMGFMIGFDAKEVYAISQNDVVSQLNSLASQYNGKTATSSQMYMGSQCKGFANWVFLRIFGVYIGPYPESANYKISNPNAQTIGIIEPGNLNVDTAKALLQKGAPGDYIQVQRNTARGRGPHSMILMSVNNSGIEVLDCNSDGKNTIKKQSISWSSFDTANRAMSLYRANGYSPSSSIPTNPQISKNQYWYDIKDRIELTAYADNATSYFMSIFKNGDKIISENVDGGKYAFDASTYGYGNYSAYFSCTNSSGTVDTQWVDFSVVGAASYDNIYTSSQWYDLTDLVSIGVDAVCAKGQVIGINKEGVGRVITENTKPLYEIEASKLGIGKYSAYFSVYNGSGGVDTKKVTFEIVDRPKEGAVVSTKKEKYTLSDKVEISVAVECAKGKVIGIDREESGRVVTEEIQGTKYSINASQLGMGNYSAYFSVYNSSGGYDTKSVTFQVICDHDYMSKIEKQPQCTEDGIKIYTCKNCGNQYTETISAFEHEHTQVCNAEVATCTSEGYTGDIYCLDCGQKISNGSKIAKKNHAVIIDNAVAATCTAEGKTEGSHCEICGMIIKAQQIIPKTEHIWDMGTVTVQATATTEGIRIYLCSICKDTKTETIPVIRTEGSTEDGKKQEESQGDADLDEGNNADPDKENNVDSDEGNNADPDKENNVDSDEGNNADSNEENGADSNEGNSVELDEGNTTDPDEENAAGIDDKDDGSKNDTDICSLEVGDVIEDDLTDAEYEVISVDASEVCVEYAESMNEKASIIVIPDQIQTENGIVCKVTAIAKGAFKNNRKMKKVFIGTNITVIGAKAFFGCRNLTSVKMGENVAELGSGVFGGCVKLKNVTLPSKVRKIGFGAFSKCKKLKKLSIKTELLASSGLNKKAFKGIPEKTVIQVPANMQKSYEKLLCQKGLSSKNKIQSLK